MTSATILTIAALVTLLITAAGAIGGSWRLSRNTQSVNIYRENAKAWQDKAELQEAEISELRLSSNVKDEQITDLRARISTLEDMVTGRSLLEQMAADSRTRYGELLNVVAGMRSELRTEHESTRKLLTRIPSEGGES
jgi:N-methylhydantoinase B/oxoprolinase/acetone carboxylase alpha subunit